MNLPPSDSICSFTLGRTSEASMTAPRRLAVAMACRPAPVLVTEDMVKAMKPGSVIVDLAAPQGGNCPLTEPGRTVIKHGVTLVGETNLPALVAADASSLYARNVLDFLKLVLPKEGGFKIDLEDDIVAACLMSRDGQVTRK